MPGGKLFKDEALRVVELCEDDDRMSAAHGIPEGPAGLEEPDAIILLRPDRTLALRFFPHGGACGLTCTFHRQIYRELFWGSERTIELAYIVPGCVLVLTKFTDSCSGEVVERLNLVV